MCRVFVDLDPTNTGSVVYFIDERKTDVKQTCVTPEDVM